MIYYVATPDHLYTIGDYLLVDIPAKARSELRMIGYPSLFAVKSPPSGVYILTDYERLTNEEIEKLKHTVNTLLSASLNSLILNHPQSVLERIDMLKAQHAASINNYSVYRFGDDLSGGRFPMFVRWSDKHKGPATGLLYNAEEVHDAMAFLATQAPSRVNKIFAAEYCAEPNSQGQFVVYGGFRAGKDVLGSNRNLSETWDESQIWNLLLTNAQSVDEYINESLDFARNFPHSPELNRAFEVAGVDYGRADYAVVGGRVNIYEINTNPRTVRTSFPRLFEQSVLFLNYLDDSFIELLQCWRIKINKTTKIKCQKFEAEHRRNAIRVLMWHLYHRGKHQKTPRELFDFGVSLTRRFLVRVPLAQKERAVLATKMAKWIIISLLKIIRQNLKVIRQTFKIRSRIEKLLNYSAPKLD